MADIPVKDLRKQYHALLAEREGILPVWRQLADNFLPLKRVLLEDGYQPQDVYTQMGSVNDAILDSTPIKSTRVLGAGMQSGMTSPAKRWHKLGHSEPAIQDLPQVKEWLEESDKIIFDTMARSNFYNNTHRCYLEVAIFGTLVMLILEDPEKRIRTICLPIGSYVLASNFKNEVDTMYREIYMTAEQMVGQFKLDKVSESVKTAYGDAGRKNQWFSVIHAIVPNKDADPEKDDIVSMPYSSVYFEKSPNTESEEGDLSRGGFRERPFVAARWDVTGESVYGDSPAMDILSFARQLQAMNATALKAEQKNADPPMNVPPGMKNASTAPGVRNYQMNSGEKITATVDIKPNTSGTLLLIQDVRRQIVEGLFNDIFRALALSPSDKMTASEVLERVSEGLRLLGPVLERLQFEFLDPIIDRIFAILFRTGLFPDIPAELEGEIVKVEYISPLAQAQKAVGLDSINKVIGIGQAIAQMDPTVLDNLNFDNLIRIYADLAGVSPTGLNSEDEVIQEREIRAEQQAALLAQEKENQDVENLKKMSETQVTADSNAIESAAAAAGA